MIRVLLSIFEEDHNIVSAIHYSRYKKLILYYIGNGSEQKGQCYENHHILPRHLYPEYSKYKPNIVRLPAKAHYIAHYLLYKAFKTPGLVFSFNQMRRVSKKYGKTNCRLYESSRIDTIALIKQSNTGRPRTEAQKQASSEKMSGTNCYRHIETGDLRRYKVGDQPECYEPFQKGRIRTQESKDLVGSKHKGRKWMYNPITMEIRFNHELIDGFVLGYDPMRERDVSYLKYLEWYHDPKTKECIRLNANKRSIPDGFIKGRLFNNSGFEKINRPDLLRVLDLQSKKVVMINRGDSDDIRYICTGTTVENTYVFKIGDTIYTSYDTLVKNNPWIPYGVPRNQKMVHVKIPKPHRNQTIARQEFNKIHAGCTLGELGLIVISVLDFNFELLKDKIYV